MCLAVEPSLQQEPQQEGGFSGNYLKINFTISWCQMKGFHTQWVWSSTDSLTNTDRHQEERQKFPSHSHSNTQMMDRWHWTTPRCCCCSLLLPVSIHSAAAGGFSNSEAHYDYSCDVRKRTDAGNTHTHTQTAEEKKNLSCCRSSSLWIIRRLKSKRSTTQTELREWRLLLSVIGPTLSLTLPVYVSVSHPLSVRMSGLSEAAAASAPLMDCCYGFPLSSWPRADWTYFPPALQSSTSHTCSVGSHVCADFINVCQ